MDLRMKARGMLAVGHVQGWEMQLLSCTLSDGERREEGKGKNENGWGEGD